MKTFGFTENVLKKTLRSPRITLCSPCLNPIFAPQKFQKNAFKNNRS